MPPSERPIPRFAAEPPPEALPERLRSVLAVLYLVFNEGYAATSGADLRRDDLAAEGVRLAGIVHALLPDEPEPAGLLALMLLHHARRAAQLGGSSSFASGRRRGVTIVRSPARCERVRAPLRILARSRRNRRGRARVRLQSSRRRPRHCTHLARRERGMLGA